MKKFVFKAVIFALIVVTPLAVLNHAYVSTNYWLIKNGTYDLKVYPEGISFANLGNSHEYAGFRYSSVYRGVAHNFAADSQSAHYGFNLLQERADAFEEGAVVVIPVSFFDFETDFEKLYSGPNKPYNTRYYPVMKDKRHIVSYVFEDDLLYNYFPALTAKEDLARIFNDVALPQKDPTDLRIVGADGDASLEDVARYKADSWEEFVMVPSDDAKAIHEATEENVHWINETIRFCEKRGFVPVLLASPVTDVLTDTLNPDRIRRFDANVQRVLDENPGLIYLDYSRDPRFSVQHMLFRDSDHLNSNGGDILTMQVLMDLAERGTVSQADLAFTPEEAHAFYAEATQSEMQDTLGPGTGLRERQAE